MKKAPIAYFAYNRPEHTLNSLRSLAENPEARESDLFIFCDAPKKPEHEKGVEEVHKIIRRSQWCRSVHIREHNTNQGCATSIINGVTQVCREHGMVIVVEDDLILSPHFLQYMNTALGLYESMLQVMQISGYMFPVELSVNTDALFLPFTTSWGWATWQRAWEYFDSDMSGYDSLKTNTKLRDKFNVNGAFNYFAILEAHLKGQVDSWAIQWYLSTFNKNGLTLYPRKTLVENIGFDGSGTHYRKALDKQNRRTPEFQVMSYPSDIVINQACFKIIKEYFKKPQKPLGLIHKILRELRKI